MTHSHHAPADAGGGLTIHGAARYDALVWLLTLGGEGRLRERILRLARLKPGERVLDIGCGTGTQAIAARRHVGVAGAVTGVDLSGEMIARARVKASRAGVAVEFREGAVQALPFADASFDVVLSTMMLHHVPAEARAAMAREVRRVLTPEGRALFVDFGAPSPGKASPLDHFHRHGSVHMDEIAAELKGEGFAVASGPVGQMSLDFVLAGTEAAVADVSGAAPARGGHMGWVVGGGAVALAVVVALHVGALASVVALLAHAPAPVVYGAVGALVLAAVVKVGLFGLAHRLGGGFMARWVRARHQGR